MGFFRGFFRLIFITRKAVSYGLDENLPPLLKWLVRILLIAYPHKSLKNQSLSDRYRHALEDLGPVFIKFGQLLSLRVDLVGEEHAKALSILQDNCAPIETQAIVSVIEENFKKPIKEVFAHFQPAPLASASIAQVHQATLKSGEKVAVKVVKPGIRALIDKDLIILKCVAWVVDSYHLQKGIQLRYLVRQFKGLIHRELDMAMEAANASVMTKKCQTLNWVKLPKIYWGYTRPDILVLEMIEGLSIVDIEALDKAGINRTRLAYAGLEMLLTQIFDHNFFHADLHPGNLIVCPTTQGSDDLGFKIALIDFGLAGKLHPQNQRYLAENYYALFKSDYAKVTEHHIRSGWVSNDIDILSFEAHLRKTIEPLSHASLQDISMAKLLMTLFNIAHLFQMTVPVELSLVDKTLLQIESIGRHLDPSLNVWQVMQPLITRFVKKQRKEAFDFRSFEGIKDLEQLERLEQTVEVIKQTASALIENPALTNHYLKQQIQKPSHFSKNNNQAKGLWFGCGLVLGVLMALVLD